MNTIVSDTSARERIAAKAVSGALYEHISGRYGVRWEGVDLPEQYSLRGDAMMRLAGLRADAILASLPSLSGEWQPIETAPMPDGSKIIGYDPRWGVTEMMRDGNKQWALATFNGQIIQAHPTFWQSLPAPPAMLSATPSSEGEGK